MFGGVGGFAVQLAKYIGAGVIATTSKANADFVRDLGADNVIDYKAQDFSTILNDVNVVLDTIGGETQAKSYRVMKPGGMLVTTATFPDAELAKVHGVSSAWMLHLSDATRLGLIGGLWDSGPFKVSVDSTFPIDQFMAALQRSATGHARGKIILTL